MTTRKLRFVSPGIRLSEVDNTQLPKVAQPVGPAVVGRARRGPALRPVTVSSMSEFIEIFGNPIPGTEGGDVWREGNLLAPSYGTYAAQAWLKNSSPLTFVRVLGAQHVNATSTGEAGWSVNRAFGLFVIPSGSGDGSNGFTNQTGSLAAVFYLPHADWSIRLSGGMAGNPAANSNTSSVGALINSTANNFSFVAELFSGSTSQKKIPFNLDRDDNNYLRKVFNTNPTLTNSGIVTTAESYWLGESFENYVNNNIGGTGSVGVMLQLITGSGTGGYDRATFKQGIVDSQTGWVISQDITTNSGSYKPEDMQKLFRFISLYTGEWNQSNLKISISNIRPASSEFNPYGRFDVIVRSIQDSDGAVRIAERFSDCNLDPNSADYVANKVGDKFSTWDETKNRYREYGKYDNHSKFIRIEMNGDVDDGLTDTSLVPFGFFGPPVLADIQFFDATQAAMTGGSPGASNEGTHYVMTNGTSQWVGNTVESGFFISGNVNMTGTVLQHPTLRLRVSSSDGGLNDQKEAYFGINTNRNASTIRFDRSHVDMVRVKSDTINAQNFSTGQHTKLSFIFSLDDLRTTGSTRITAWWQSGSRGDGDSRTAQQSDWRQILTDGYNRFTMPLHGGFDGVEVIEKDPFNNTRMGSTEESNYAYNSVKRCIDAVSNAEIVETNLLAAPGITKNTLTAHMLTVAENRADTLAIIDLPSVFTPPHEATATTFANRVGGNPTSVVNALRDRGLNNSYGCTYYPWVKIFDEIHGVQVFVPPSVVALGTFANTEAVSELWFAPAGFNRGGLNGGDGGLPVIGVTEDVLSEERDELYAANINPIAKFPAEGVVVMGQKTLQVTQSALDRINVRRMLIFVKKEISRIATRILFEQNVQQTWNAFLGEIEPFLQSVKTRLGLSDFKVVLDASTTTPDLVDRNILHAKVFLKPSRSIEFIDIQFNISSTGAAFED